MSTKKLEEMRFDVFLNKVERNILAAQHMAALTGTSYTFYCGARTLYVYKGAVSIYKLPMDPHIILVEDETTLKSVAFRGKVISNAGSIVFMHTGLRKKATITIRVATGKITLYKTDNKT